LLWQPALVGCCKLVCGKNRELGVRDGRVGCLGMTPRVKRGGAGGVREAFGRDCRGAGTRLFALTERQRAGCSTVVVPLSAPGSGRVSRQF
jgi:hypothetical protein